MSTLVAIDFGEQEATFVTAETSRGGKITILHVEHRPSAELIPAGPAAAANGVSGAQADGAPVSQELVESTTSTRSTATNGLRRERLEDLVGEVVDGSLATLPSSHVVYERLELPFSAPRRLEQVVPLQLQDLVPFDVEAFVIDSVVIGRTAPASFEVLSGMALRNEVAHVLTRLAQIGANPKLLTTRASAIAALVELFPGELVGTFGILLIDRDQASLALFVNSVLRMLREIPLRAPRDSTDRLRNLFRDLRCSIAHLEEENGVPLERLFVVGSENTVARLSSIAGMPFEALDLSRSPILNPGPSVNVNEYAWALGLFAHEVTRRRSDPLRLINLRRGEFAFKPGLENFVEAVKEEGEWFLFLVLAVVLWLGSVFATGSSKLRAYEDFIRQEIATVLPREPIPYRAEKEFLEERISELRTQLAEMGSVSSLSPLEVLRELSTIFPPGIDVTIDTITIRSNGVEFSGSVDSVPTLGRVSGALEKHGGRFCETRFDPKGKTPKQRVGFDASVVFCD